MDEKIEIIDIADELIIIPKIIIDEFLKFKNPSELIALYSFYYYTAKWQKTNQPKCTTIYASNGLHWNKDKIIKVKNQLKAIGLVNDFKQIDQNTHKVKGWYIKINYILKKTTVEESLKNHPPLFPEGGNSQRVEIEDTNALSSYNLNALSSNNNILFEKFWNLYNKKVGKQNALNQWNKLNKDDIDKVFANVELYVKSKPDKKYRKDPERYLAKRVFEDEIINSFQDKNTGKLPLPANAVRSFF
jgi:hypothetical protein